MRELAAVAADASHRSRQRHRSTQRRSVLALAIICCAAVACERAASTPAEPTLAAITATPPVNFDVGNPEGDPPQAWVDNPTEIGPDVPQSASNCDLVNYPFPATLQAYYHPNAVCRQKEWGNSGIIRQQGHDLHVTTLPKCNGGPGDIAEIRLCKHGWENQQTTWGKAGPLGCIGVTVTPTCES